MFKKAILIILTIAVSLNQSILIFGENSTINNKERTLVTDWINHWGSNSIETAMMHGWVSVNSLFRPDDSITRAEAIKILVEAYDFKKTKEVMFSDVNKNDWYYNYVSIALANNVISEDIYFRPNDKITRQEFATTISNIETKKQGDPNHDKYIKYEDYNDSGSWAKNSIEYVIEKGYMGVNSNKFNPLNNITRAEAVTTLIRSINPVSANINIPKINYAYQSRIKINSNYGEPIGGSAVEPWFDEIKGNLYVKYGDSKLGAHNYRTTTQEDYDTLVNWTTKNIKNIDFKLQVDWVYLQCYFKGNKNKNFIHPILKLNGNTVNFGQWLDKYSNLLNSFENGYISIEDLEKLVVYRSICNYLIAEISNQLGTSQEVETVHHLVYPSIGPNWHSFYSLVGDIIGMNTMVVGNAYYGGGIVDMVQVGDYWWINGLERGIKKTENPFTNYDVKAAPTYNLESFYLN